MSDQQPSVRDMIKAVQDEMRKGNLTPEIARERLNLLAALKGNIMDEIVLADDEFNVVLLHYLDTEKRANRAKIRAETTKEYRRKREALNTDKLADTMIGALKYHLRSHESEYRNLSR